MIIKGLNECDIVNYKKSSMFIIKLPVVLLPL